jgi:signal transduction histidine kinase
LCEAETASIMIRDDEAYRPVATFATLPDYDALLRKMVFAVDRGTIAGRTALERRVVHVADIAADPEHTLGEAITIGKVRTALGVPLLREGEPIGVLILNRRRVEPFNKRQIELVRTFADQAVIAIENTRLLTELQQRTRDLQESLEYQTATSEVLQVISRSAFDLRPVLDTLVETAGRLCNSDGGGLAIRDGEAFRYVALHGATEEFQNFLRQRTFAPGRDTGTERVLLEGKVVHIPDVTADPEYVMSEMVTLGDWRTYLGVPLPREGTVVGVITLNRRRAEPFTERQIELVRTFAAQAVIAIENTRLLNELRESLQQQTATADVLKVISRSTFDLKSVLQTLLESAAKLCDADKAITTRQINRVFYLAEAYGFSREFVDYAKDIPIEADRGSAAGRALLEGNVIHIPDVKADSEYRLVEMQSLGDYRTILCVPMLREGVPIGVLTLMRSEVRRFTDKQIELVTTFADQAVIAIENVRLLDELRVRTDQLAGSVQELQALGQVSQAVNSTLDLETVLSTIVAKAVQLSGTEAGAIYVFDNEAREFHLRATFGMSQELIEALTQQRIGLDEPNITPAFMQGESIQAADLREGVASAANEIILRAGFRARLVAPLVRGDEIVGMLVVRRRTAGAFPQNTVDLMKTFAAQSALAIQNARLFHEIEDKSRQLEIASKHKSQFLANMSHELRTPLNAILGYTELILDSIYGEAPKKMRDVLERVQTNGKHLLGLINDVLDLSKIEAGQVTLSLADYSLADLIQGVYVAVEPLAAQKNLALRTNIASGLPAGHGDERRLAQVLLNLVGNAIKFTESGEVAIEASCSDGSFRIAVRDSGPGISLADQAKIFEEFQQVDNALTRAKRGTGLGLAISKRIIEMHGGRILVDSEVGKGATFTISLPVSAKGKARAA